MSNSQLLAGGSKIRRTDDADGYGAQLSIAASRKRVYEALTTTSGIAGWWFTQDVRGSAADGGEFTVVWGGGAAEFVAQAEAAERASVRWKCLAKKPESEWVGTEISFKLSEVGPDLTAVSFRHTGLVPILECFEHCEAGWGQVLESFARYVAGAGGDR
jgi:uncharacterized protein YndB with AHSA1/START domain